MKYVVGGIVATYFAVLVAAVVVDIADLRAGRWRG